MTSQEDHERSQQGLLHRDNYPVRPSLDGASRASSESIGGFHEFDTSPKRHSRFRNGRPWPWAPKFRRIISGERPPWASEERIRSHAKRAKICFCQRRTCQIIMAVVIAGLLVLLGLGVFYLYKTAPEDGVCVEEARVQAKLTRVPVEITAMVSFAPGWDPRSLVKELRKSTGDGQANDLGGQGEYYNRRWLVSRFLRWEHRTCEYGRLPRFMFTGRTAWSSLHGS